MEKEKGDGKKKGNGKSKGKERWSKQKEMVGQKKQGTNTEVKSEDMSGRGDRQRREFILVPNDLTNTNERQWISATFSSLIIFTYK